MKALIMVGLGGFAGAIARYVISNAINRWAPSGFPWGILVANVLGCLLIGILISQVKGDWRLLLITGFLGSLTTFSTFGLDTFELMRGDRLALAFGNIGLSVLLGLLAVWAGNWIGEAIRP